MYAIRSYYDSNQVGLTREVNPAAEHLAGNFELRAKLRRMQNQLGAEMHGDLRGENDQRDQREQAPEHA